MLDFCYNVISWTPWISFLSECAAIQFCLLLSLFFFNQSKTLFYSVIYMLLLFIWLGIFLAYFNVELFTGFLWVVELTVIFILVLFLFYFNFSGELRTSKFFFFKFMLVVVLLFFFDNFSLKLDFLNFNFFFENFYELRSSALMNDLHSLFLSYYYFNGFLLFLFGFLVFLVSIVCVNLLRASKVVTLDAVLSALSVYNFFADLLNFEFLRKQNLFHQNLRKSNSRLVRKESKAWFRRSQD
jgi:hypothetical protein